MVHCIPVVIGYKVEYKFLIEKNLCINFSPRPECLQIFNFLVIPYLKGFVPCHSLLWCPVSSWLSCLAETVKFNSSPLGIISITERPRGSILFCFGREACTILWSENFANFYIFGCKLPPPSLCKRPFTRNLYQDIHFAKKRSVLSSWKSSRAYKTFFLCFAIILSKIPELEVVVLKNTENNLDFKAKPVMKAAITQCVFFILVSDSFQPPTPTVIQLRLILKESVKKWNCYNYLKLPHGNIFCLLGFIC